VSEYRPGDNYVICDECGFRFHASETLKRWDGMRVCRADFETRHPQDFVRGRYDKQLPAVVRPEPPDRFVVDRVFMEWSDGDRVQWSDGSHVEW